MKNADGYSILINYNFYDEKFNFTQTCTELLFCRELLILPFISDTTVFYTLFLVNFSLYWSNILSSSCVLILQSFMILNVLLQTKR